MLVGLRVARSLFLRLNLNVRISFLSRIYTLYTNKRLLCFVRSSVATAIKADLSQRFLMFCCFFFLCFFCLGCVRSWVTALSLTTLVWYPPTEVAWGQGSRSYRVRVWSANGNGNWPRWPSFTIDRQQGKSDHLLSCNKCLTDLIAAECGLFGASYALGLE